MKVKHTNNKKNLIIASASILTLLLLSGVAYGLFIQPYQNHTNDTTGQTQPSQSTRSEDKSPESTPAPSKPSESNTDIPAPVTTDDSTGKQLVQMVVSVNIANEVVYIRGGINNAVVTSGSCFAQLSGPSGESIKQDTVLLQNASTTDCKTISISSSSLSKGVWTVILKYTSNQMEGQSSEASFTIK